MLATGEVGQPDTDKAVDVWAGEITKKWSSLAATKKAGQGQAPGAGVQPLQASQDPSQALHPSDAPDTGSAGRYFAAYGIKHPCNHAFLALAPALGPALVLALPVQLPSLTQNTHGTS